MKLNAATLVILALSAGASAQNYRAINLGKLVSGDNDAGRMNNAGQIVGGDSLGAILWTPSGTSFTVTRLGDPRVASYDAASINSSGQVVGASQPLGGGVTTPIVYQGSTAVALPTLGGTSGVATSINDAGLIVGQSRTASETDPLSAGDAVLWNGSEVIDLGTVLGGNDSFAEAINNSNQIVGTNFAVPSGSAAVVWTMTNNQVAVQSLPVGTAIGSEALDINDSGQIVGLANFQSGNSGSTHAALWSPTGSSYTFQILGDLGGGFSVAASINRAGDVVGGSLVNAEDAVTHATLWTGGKIVDLNAAVTPALPAFITLKDAGSINDGGSIVVGSVDSRTGAISSYLLVPIQPPPLVTLSPTSLSFTNQSLNSSSAAQNITLTNNGAAALKLTSITRKGGQADDYSLTKNCGASLAVGASCVLSVSFKPISEGTKKASISIADDALDSPQSVALNGTAVGVPTLNLSATALTFARQSVGTTSATQTVTLTNSGTGVLKLISFHVKGGQADDYILARTCSTSLAVNASCAVSVTFRPVSVGSKKASISITDNASGSPQSVALTGSGASR